MSVCPHFTIDLTSLFEVMDKALNSDPDAEADHPVAIRA